MQKHFYYIGYVTIEKDQKKYSVNPLHLFFSKVNGYFQEINGNKYLTLGATLLSEYFEKLSFLHIFHILNIY